MASTRGRGKREDIITRGRRSPGVNTGNAGMATLSSGVGVPPVPGVKMARATTNIPTTAVTGAGNARRPRPRSKVLGVGALEAPIGKRVTLPSPNASRRGR